MSARLDQALERLNAAVAALESMPVADPQTAPSSSSSSSSLSSSPNTEEIAEIRQLVDQAMAIISARQPEDNGGGHGTE